MRSKSWPRTFLVHNFNTICGQFMQKLQSLLCIKCGQKQQIHKINHDSWWRCIAQKPGYISHEMRISDDILFLLLPYEKETWFTWLTIFSYSIPWANPNDKGAIQHNCHHRCHHCYHHRRLPLIILTEIGYILCILANCSRIMNR